jgi:hypothetical protein
MECRLTLCADESRTRIAYLRTALRGLNESWQSPAAIHFQRDCHEALERSERAFLVAQTLALRLSNFRQRLELAEGVSCPPT